MFYEMLIRMRHLCGKEILNVCLCLWMQGVQCRTLQGHAHWVNTLALSTDYVLRTGAFEPATATVNPQDLTGSCKAHNLLLGCWF